MNKDNGAIRGTVSIVGTHPTDEKTPRWHLMQEILKRSESKYWTMAVKEWKLTSIKRSRTPHTCLCTHYPILELCYLYNEKTNERVIVGNCCVRLFDLVPTKVDSVFRALTRGRLNKSLIEYAHQNAIITDWEYKFSGDTWRKRVLTDKQWAKRDKITERILRALGGR